MIPVLELDKVIEAPKLLEPLPQGSRIGILGGGQLGRMLAIAGAALGFDVHVFEPEADCPAGRVAAHCVTARWDDLAALAQFAVGVDVLTFEFENVPAASLAHVAAIKPIRPGIKSLELTQDRLVEKNFINQLGLTTAQFSQIDTLADLEIAVSKFGPVGILKTRRFGYDGKGQIRLSEDSDLGQIWDQIKDQAWIFEGFVDFAYEVSVVLARGEDGVIAAFDVTQNSHKGGILHSSTVPSSLSPSQIQVVLDHATVIAQALGHVGVLAIEFFVGSGERLIINEIAPRVHNSGHWTQDGCYVCQFQQHMRAVAGWPLGNPVRNSRDIEMTNLIGDDINSWLSFASAPGTFVHLYGKREIRAGRKMGHVNQIKK